MDELSEPLIEDDVSTDQRYIAKRRTPLYSPAEISPPLSISQLRPKQQPYSTLFLKIFSTLKLVSTCISILIQIGCLAYRLIHTHGKYEAYLVFTVTFIIIDAVDLITVWILLRKVYHHEKNTLYSSSIKDV